MFEGFPALAAVNNARERVRPMPAGGRHGGRPEHLRALTSMKSGPAWIAITSPTTRSCPWPATSTPPRPARRSSRISPRSRPASRSLAPLEPGAPNFFVPVRPRGGPGRGVGRRADDGLPGLPRRRSPDERILSSLSCAGGAALGRGVRLGGGGTPGSPVFFTPLDDGTVVAISLPIRDGEPPAKAFERIEAFVAETIAPKLGPRRVGRVDSGGTA